MYAKLIDNTLTYAPRVLRLDDVTIFNPTEETLKEQGYKPLEETDRPAFEDGFSFEPHYEETDDKIVQVWDKIALPVFEPYESEVDKILRGVYD